ncbi:AzlD domain-containing protein [Tropicibacter sp. R15_0]|uniref:AzlD family protein n=1 Tax=Tropicibacter sp. R15_0 TaxID=2821101 RepID=UPI001AD98306|nr:AzlD domain-containing protein [Tropicibacter sp. R15_0]MBO9464997.1 AzlD domain-containing protein [Tropicibacter sp. R15_0]
MNETIVIILLCAMATYLTRAGGHLIMLQFGKVHHRVEAALSAVPVAILTALVAPSALNGGLPGVAAMLVTGLICLRGSLLIAVAAGVATLLALRAMGM